MSDAYSLDDPRRLAAEAPYTFMLPSDEELAALAPGDHAKLIFVPTPGGRKWGAERMWVKIERVEGDRLEGSLDNIPEDIPGLEVEDRVSFHRHHVIACQWAEGRAAQPPPRRQKREYWQRCLVDRCVLDDGAQVHFIYREPPDLAQADDQDEDSGWRIRGDYRGQSDDEIEAREMEYVAIGKVLNVDDNWLPLIDSPVGSAFIRDWATGMFVPEEAQGSPES